MPNAQTDNLRLETKCNVERCLGLMCVYNEEDILEQTLRYHIDEGVEFLVLDNGSSDSSLQIARSFLGKGVLGVQVVPTDTYQWARLLDTLIVWAHDYHPDWCMLIDADTFLESPWPGVGLVDGIRCVAEQGFNVINFDNFEFWPVVGTDYYDLDIRHRMRHYTWADDRRETCWKAFIGASNSRTGGHEIDLPANIKKNRAPVNFVMRHYRIRSVEHGRRKVFKDRLHRFQGEPEGWHVHYNGFGEEPWYYEVPREWLNECKDGFPWSCVRKFHGWDPRVLPFGLLPARSKDTVNNSEAPADVSSKRSVKNQQGNEVISGNSFGAIAGIANADYHSKLIPAIEEQPRTGERLSLRDYVHVLVGENLAVAVDAVTFEIAYISPFTGHRILALRSSSKSDQDALAQKLPITVINGLAHAGFLGKFEEADRLEPYRLMAYPQPFRVLDIIPTFDCNLACKYCYQVDSCKHGGRWYRCKLSVEEGKAIVKEFLDSQPSVIFSNRIRAEICFIGGEPLLHWPLLAALIPWARKHEKGSPNSLNLTVVTNGTLITSEMASLFAANDVFIIVSLDGRRCTNDQARITRSGSGSFDRTLQGYVQLKQAGCRVGISQLIAKHNIATFQDDTRYLLDTLKPDDLCINSCLHSNPGQLNPLQVGSLDFARGLASLLDTLANQATSDSISRHKQDFSHLPAILDADSPFFNGDSGNSSLLSTDGFRIPEQLIMRFSDLLLRQTKLHYCPAQSHKLVVGPSGEAWCCEGFAYLGHGGQSWRRWIAGGTVVEETRSHWAAASPVNNSTCRSCPLVLQCGLGCRYDASIQRGAFLSRDPYRCEQELWLFRWFLLKFVPRLCKIGPLKDSEVHCLNDLDRKTVERILVHSQSKVAWR